MDKFRNQGSDIYMQMVRDVIFGVRTFTPARVISVEKDSEDKPIYLTVQPLIKETRNIDGAKPEDLKEIDRVPVWMPRTRKAILNLPVEEGDIVALAFSDRSLDNWLQSSDGATVDHQDTRNHDLSDAIAFPGFYPYTFSDPTKANQSDFGLTRQIADDETDIVNMVIEENGNVKISTSHSVSVSGGSVSISGGTVSIGAGKDDQGAGGDINVNAEADLSLAAEGDASLDADGEVKIGGDAGESAMKGNTFASFFDAHRHLCPSCGGFTGIVDPAVNMSTTPGLLSAKVKIDG